MNTEQAYDKWAEQYDSDKNLTRDLEGKAIRKVLDEVTFDSCLEVGCGTGKNTVWLIQKAKEMVSIDFSKEMIAKAKEKIKNEKIHFVHADITQDWDFTDRNYSLITFSLILEHIEDVDAILKKASSKLKPGGYIYIGELHPFKQYSGSKAKFETAEGQQVLKSYTHHISDYTCAATGNDLNLIDLQEYFDEGNRDAIPRIMTLLFRKKTDDTNGKT